MIPLLGGSYREDVESREEVACAVEYLGQECSNGLVAICSLMFARAVEGNAYE